MADSVATKESENPPVLAEETVATCNDKDEIRICLVGMTGSGKSATGNTILGSSITKPFSSGSNPESTTKHCQLKRAEILGRNLAVIDTPGFFDTITPSKESQQEIGNCLTMTTPGPHALLLVLKIGTRFTKEVCSVVSLMKHAFGPQCANFIIFVFTAADALEREDTTIDEYIADMKGPFEDLLKECGNRYVQFNNTFKQLTSKDNETQVTNLLNMIEKMIAENGGHYDTSILFVEAKRAFEVEEKKGRDNLKKAEQELSSCQEMAKRLEQSKSSMDAAEFRQKWETAQMVQLAQQAQIDQLHRQLTQMTQTQETMFMPSGCFAADSKVRVQDADGKIIGKYLEDVAVGDLVESYDSTTNTITFSPVYYMIYQDDNFRVTTLRALYFNDNSGHERCIRLHPKHLIYASTSSMTKPLDHQPVMSEKIRTGDTLWVRNDEIGDLSPKRVRKIEEVISRIRHPLTESHVILVDGVLASVHMHNEWVSRYATAPLRLLYTLSPSISEYSVVRKIVHSWELVEKYVLEAKFIAH